MLLNIVGRPGPSIPLSIRGARQRLDAHIGRADPTWVTAFTTKFSRKPAEDAPLVTPHGAAKVIQSFLDRVEELRWMEETQHQELPTTLAEFKANGISAFSLTEALEEDMDSANIAEAHLSIVPLSPDPAYASAMQRRIEWEQYIWACGAVHKTRFIVRSAKPTCPRCGTIGWFVLTDMIDHCQWCLFDGKPIPSPVTEDTVMIVYDGPDSKNAEKRAAHRKTFKDAWLAHFGTLPTVEELTNDLAFVQFYGKPVLASMTAEEFATHRQSRLYGGNEDPDPLRAAFESPTAPDPEAYDFRIASERDEYTEERARWRKETEAQSNLGVGYAGPSGMLGIDDDNDDEGSI